MGRVLPGHKEAGRYSLISLYARMRVQSSGNTRKDGCEGYRVGWSLVLKLLQWVSLRIDAVGMTCNALVASRSCGSSCTLVFHCISSP